MVPPFSSLSSHRRVDSIAIGTIKIPHFPPTKLPNPQQTPPDREKSRILPPNRNVGPTNPDVDKVVSRR